MVGDWGALLLRLALVVMKDGQELLRHQSRHVLALLVERSSKEREYVSCCLLYEGTREARAFARDVLIAMNLDWLLTTIRKKQEKE